MTPGRWIAIVAQTLLRKETFERLVSPAIADLQFERDALTLRLAGRHYAGIVFATLAGVGFDLRADASTIFERDTGRSAWPALAMSLVVTAGAGVMSMRLNSPMFWSMYDGLRTTFLIGVTVLTVQFAIVAIPSAMLPFAALLTRGRTSRRAAILAACVVATVSLAALRTLPQAIRDYTQPFVVAEAVQRRGPEPIRSWTLLQVRDALVSVRPPAAVADIDVVRGGRTMLQALKEHRPPKPALSLSLSVAVSAIAFALIGHALRRKRLWILLGTATLLHGLHTGGLSALPGFVPISLSSVYGRWAATWSPTILLFLLALWLAVRQRRDLHAAH